MTTEIKKKRRGRPPKKTYEAQKRYAATKQTIVTLKFNNELDKDIIEYLSKQDSKLVTIRAAVRDYMNK